MTAQLAVLKRAEAACASWSEAERAVRAAPPPTTWAAPARGAGDIWSVTPACASRLGASVEPTDVFVLLDMLALSVIPVSISDLFTTLKFNLNH